ncbi:phage major tail tube protein [Vibrio vulnificus]|uniref:phage major tail tube protein n=1 Tax=Vibrio TaxID=662 RepID=UPI00192F16DE|nr:MULTISPECIES: phage major tail tube protein [Vibrio]EHZ7344559.1 phage major tail tube protein [Vibrio vulnificus]MBE3670916.1 hypothetical protein [Vibrio navarrensis]MBN8090456.1 phage major tail tube protein [Vibrio vulnificus]MBN8119360.1 phage major tail tube protein [Vibrio vulnificus]
MASRVIHGRKLTLPGGIKITNNIGDFTPPKYEKVYVDVPGSFMAQKVHVGFEASEWQVTIKGEMAAIVNGALAQGDETVIIYTENGNNKGSRFESEHTMTGEVSFEYDASKMREQQTLTLKGQISKHRWVDAGVPITDVDIDNGLYTIGGKQYNL